MYAGIIALPRRGCTVRQCGDQRDDLALQDRKPAAQVQAKVQRDLLVARAAGVEPAPDVPETIDELPLDERVHVLVGPRDEPRVVPPGPANLDQRVANGAGVRG